MKHQIKMWYSPMYETPQVEVIEVEVEKGFAASGDPTVGGDDVIPG